RRRLQLRRLVGCLAASLRGVYARHAAAYHRLRDPWLPPRKARARARGGHSTRATSGRRRRLTTARCAGPGSPGPSLSSAVCQNGRMPENQFGERVAARYDESSAEMFEPAVVDPVVDFLAELAGGGAALELGIGTGRIALPLA